MKKSLALLCSVLALGLVATGCGGDDDEDSGDSGGGDQAEKAPAPAGGGKTSGVQMSNTQFNPKSLSIERGGKVRWSNEDSVGHDVTKTAGPGPQFKSGSAGGMTKGDSYEQAFSTPGQVKYVCTVHPGMEGTVTVK